ncbi:MAG: IS6 family transposase [Coxiella sp. (in: Bacteria)]|nr:MAG: IS6 family transposase [Coxiella sp. (in: g-proteobacteria)]
MQCPHCESMNTRECKSKTALGYRQFRCRSCTCQYNERTGTSYNHVHYPAEVIMFALYLYYRFRNSLDDVVELMITRGVHLSHQTIYNWAHTFGVELAKKFQKMRYGETGLKWHADATYIRVEGRWCYLYRAIDKEGHLVDVYLSDTRDQNSAEYFFLQAETTTGITPDQITTDKEPALTPALDNVFGNCTKHRDNKYMNNRIESDHRVTKSRLRIVKGFKDIFSALRFCTVFEEIRQYFRMKNKSRAQKRKLLASKIYEFNKIGALAG